MTTLKRKFHQFSDSVTYACIVTLFVELLFRQNTNFFIKKKVPKWLEREGLDKW